MKSFNSYITEHKVLAEQVEELIEKLIIVGGGKSYGQIIFLAGGAGSGKGFAISNFLEGNKFKVRDVDEWKKLTMKMSKHGKISVADILKKHGRNITDKNKELIDKEMTKKNVTLDQLDLKNPQHVYLLHILVDALKIKDKTLENMMKTSKDKARKGILDNIIFDITAKNFKAIEGVAPKLVDIGYDPKNIHIIWILTDYEVAVRQNATRDRVVPADILLQTHEGAALTMSKITRNSYKPAGTDGGIYVILGGNKHSILWTDKNGKPIKGAKKGNVTVKDFKYLQVKKPGGKFVKDILLQTKLYSWILDNAPATLNTKDMW